MWSYNDGFVLALMPRNVKLGTEQNWYYTFQEDPSAEDQSPYDNCIFPSFICKITQTQKEIEATVE